MIRIHFRGALEKLVPNGYHDCAVRSPYHAIRFLEGVVPGFKKEFRSGGYFLSFKKNGEKIDSDSLRLLFGHRNSLYFMPLALGAKGGGGAQGIAPESTDYEEKEDDISALFNGGTNTTEQGVCRPLIYGRVRDSGSAVISAGISIGYDESLV